MCLPSILKAKLNQKFWNPHRFSGIRTFREIQENDHTKKVTLVLPLGKDRKLTKQTIDDTPALFGKERKMTKQQIDDSPALWEREEKDQTTN